MKKCSKCSTEFECGSKIGKCWCMDLKEEFTDCLCPKCLKEYASL